MPESLFTFLFKYRPVVFEHGRLVFETSRPVVLLLATLAVALVLGTMYLRQRARVGGSTVAVLTAIRTLILALVVLAPDSDSDAESIKVWANQELSKSQRVAAVELYQDLPKNHLGKILKMQLREELRAAEKVYA